MSAFALQELTRSWDAEDVDIEARVEQGRPLFGTLLKEINFHAEHRFWHFAPTYFGGPRFYERFYAWVTNPSLSTAQQQILFRVLLNLHFIDRDDALALYRSAFTGPIGRWLVDQLGLAFDGEVHVERELRRAADETWFCPVTDSMDIAQFHHVNRLAGHDQRPPWRSLRQFADQDKIQHYVRQKELRRVVLLEDFVGSGTQSVAPVRFSIETLCPIIPILFVPLLCSEAGANRFRALAADHVGFAFSPLYVIPNRMHVRADADPEEPTHFGSLRELVNATFAQVREPVPPEVAPLADADAFGFRGVGSLVVLHSNCPNNTLPLVWHEAPCWRSLFKRVSRA